MKTVATVAFGLLGVIILANLIISVLGLLPMALLLGGVGVGAYVIGHHNSKKSLKAGNAWKNLGR